MTASQPPHSTRNATHSPAATEPQGCLGGLCRMYWMLFGNGALVLVTLTVAQSGRVSYRDVLFWALVASMILARYIDITRLAGQTTSCERASLRDWRRYVLALVGTAAVAWSLAHTVLGRLFA